LRAVGRDTENGSATQYDRLIRRLRDHRSLVFRFAGSLARGLQVVVSTADQNAAGH